MPRSGLWGRIQGIRESEPHMASPRHGEMGFPEWARNAIMALVIPRAVRQAGRGRLGPWRHLRRSIGIGGIASLFIWNLVFDPVVVAMRRAVGARAPTYVDDLAALVRGPRQAARVPPRGGALCRSTYGRSHVRVRDSELESSKRQAGLGGTTD